MEKLDFTLFHLYFTSEGDYQCWCYFVEACQLTSQLVLYQEHIAMAHDLIVKFCSTFERLYGKDMCTPNMHMVCHLTLCRPTCMDKNALFFNVCAILPFIS